MLHPIKEFEPPANPGRFKVPLTRIREPDTRIVSLKERNDELLLQTHDLATGSGLPDSDSFGRPSQASILSGCYEVAYFGKPRHVSAVSANKKIST